MTGKKLAAGWVVQLTLRQLTRDVEPDTPAPTFQFFNIQDAGGTRAAVEAGVARVRAMLPHANAISRTSLSAEHLTLALLTNPYHPDGLATDLDQALRMPRDERITRHSALRAIVWRDTAAAWAKRFLDELRS